MRPGGRSFAVCIDIGCFAAAARIAETTFTPVVLVAFGGPGRVGTSYSRGAVMGKLRALCLEKLSLPMAGK